MEAANKGVLGSICTIIDCEHKTAPTQDEGIPLIRTPNIGAGHLILDSAKRVSEQVYAAWTRRAKPEPGDLIMAREAPVGNVALIRINQRVCLGQRTVLLRFRDKKTSPYYLNYLLNSPAVKTYVNLLANGATVGHLNVADIRKLALPKMPSLTAQDKIAAILSAYDDLIENNRRRIALLEKMAEEIYREWFVRLRFPGHEQVKVEKGVPAGWRFVKLEQAFKYQGGATPSKDVARYWNDGIVNWYTPSDITAAEGLFLEQSGEQCTEEGLATCSARLFPAYSVMMTSRATIGAIGINLTPASTNQGFITCIPNENYPLAYLYHWLKLSKPHFESLSGGATFAELTKGTFKRIEILTPPKAVVTEFEKHVGPMFRKIEVLLKTNARLKKGRDALLPRLISGKLPIEALDIRFPPSMEEPAHEV